MIYQLNKGFHLGCEPFVLVIEQLPVHGDSAVGDMEAGDTPGGEGRTDDVSGRKESPIPRSTIWQSSEALPSSM